MNLDQNWADHAVAFKCWDMVMNQWSNCFILPIYYIENIATVRESHSVFYSIYFFSFHLPSPLCPYHVLGRFLSPLFELVLIPLGDRSCKANLKAIVAAIAEDLVKLLKMLARKAVAYLGYLPGP